MTKLRLLDIFSGIGGFSLGLERSGGFETSAFCEIEDFPRRVLAKHWPKVPCYHDIRELTAERLAADGITVDAICGGFPCQDISLAGGGAGLAGERSGLWSEYARLVREIRPRVVFVENSAALLRRGLGVVLSDLAEIGYDQAEWHCFPASYIGACHKRDRVWIIAYSDSIDGQGRTKKPIFRQSDLSQQPSRGIAKWARRSDLPSPRLSGGDDGVSERSHRLRALGNAVVPQIPELLGRAWMEANQ